MKHEYDYQRERLPHALKIARSLCSVSEKTENFEGFAVIITRAHEAFGAYIEWKSCAYTAQDEIEALRYIVREFDFEATPYNTFVGIPGKPKSLKLLADILTEDLAEDLDQMDMWDEFETYRKENPDA
jgi:hypothetical protein